MPVEGEPQQREAEAVAIGRVEIEVLSSYGRLSPWMPMPATLSQFDRSASFQSLPQFLSVPVGTPPTLLIGFRSPPPDADRAAADEVEIGMIEVVGVEIVDQRRGTTPLPMN